MKAGLIELGDVLEVLHTLLRNQDKCLDPLKCHPALNYRAYLCVPPLSDTEDIWLLCDIRMQHSTACSLILDHSQGMAYSPGLKPLKVTLAL